MTGRSSPISDQLPQCGARAKQLPILANVKVSENLWQLQLMRGLTVDAVGLLASDSLSPDTRRPFGGESFPDMIVSRRDLHRSQDFQSLFGRTVMFQDAFSTRHVEI